MTTNPTNLPRQTLQVLIWSEAGTVLANQHAAKRTLSIASEQPCDIFLPDLAPGDSFFLMVGAEHCELLYQNQDQGKSQQFKLDWGEPQVCHQFRFLLLRPSPALVADKPLAIKAADSKREDIVARLIDPLLAWSQVSMTTPLALHVGLEQFLELAIRGSKAHNGMMVLAETGGFRMIASHGLSLEEAHSVWDKMPENITLEIMKTKASMILPEGLRDKSGNKSTVFVKNIRSLVGFPLMAEEKLYGILYLGFKNIFTDLSPELEAALERSANLAGLILQRALLREQLAHQHQMAPAIGGGQSDNGQGERLMLGTSPEIKQVYRMIERFAHVDIPVLITGETGTGKELAAKEIHRMSPRQKKPFVVINAAALPPDIIESELFGHKKGAFTGALADRVGLIEQADKGTLFIDEIGELPLSVQTKFLRVLQERTVCRIGESQIRKVDFRLVAATHRNLKQMVEDGSFREDLYYRIAGSVIMLPPLRDRGGDILLLANFFKQRFCRFHNLPNKEWSWEAIQVLSRQPWAGNVRELENVVTRSYMMAEGLVINRRDVDVQNNGMAQSGSGNFESNFVHEENLGSARNAWMKAFIAEALTRHQGNRVKTAEALGIGQRTLFRYIEQFGIRD